MADLETAKPIGSSNRFPSQETGRQETLKTYPDQTTEEFAALVEELRKTYPDDSVPSIPKVAEMLGVTPSHVRQILESNKKVSLALLVSLRTQIALRRLGPSGIQKSEGIAPAWSELIKNLEGLSEDKQKRILQMGLEFAKSYREK